MNRPGKKASVAAIAFATATGVALWATQGVSQAAGPFTAAQVDAGHNAYVTNCAVCHGDTMSGINEAPPLAGHQFVSDFGSKTTKDLFDIVKTEMPANAPGSLSDETYTDLVAFMLHASGAATGTTPLTPTTAVPIGTVASGTVAPEVAAGLKTISAAPAAGAGP